MFVFYFPVDPKGGHWPEILRCLVKEMSEGKREKSEGKRGNE